MGDTLLKVASKLAIEMCAPALRDLFGDAQCGILAPRGAEGIVHRVREFSADPTAEAHFATLDLSNAFNAIDRQAIWSVVQRDEFAPLQGVFALEYATPSRLIGAAEGEPFEIPSTRGTRQGSACGPVFFCLGIHGVLERLAEQNVIVEAYMDDVTLMTRNPQDLQRAVEVARVEFAARGLALNLKKCQWISSATPPDGWTRYEEPTVKLLGGHIRTSCKAGWQAEAAKVENDVKKHRIFFDRLQMMKGAVATAILGASAVPKLGYLIRTHDAQVTEKACIAFDLSVEATWIGIIGVDKSVIPEAAMRLAALPCKSGGMGFVSAAATRASAYRASLEQSQGAKTTQTALMMQAIAEEVAALDEDVSTAALRRANAEKGTSTWFRDPTTSMPPHDFAAAMRLRLGIPLPGMASKPTCPGCSLALPTRAAWIQHVTGCARLSGRNSSARHAELKVALKDVATTHAISADTSEPRLMKTLRCHACALEMHIADWRTHAVKCGRLTPEQRKREPHASGPDIRFYVGNERVTVDVTVVNPVNPSAVAGKRMLPAVFRQVEQRKVAKYGEAVKQAGDVFQVIALSAQGAASKATDALIARFVGESASPDAFHAAKRRLVAAVVLGSARSLRSANNNNNNNNNNNGDAGEESCGDSGFSDADAPEEEMPAAAAEAATTTTTTVTAEAAADNLEALTPTFPFQSASQERVPEDDGASGVTAEAEAEAEAAAAATAAAAAAAANTDDDVVGGL